MKGSHVWVFVIAFASVTCGKTESMLCDPGAERACECIDGRQGTEYCRNGTGWDVCDCGGAVGTGGGPSGGAGGAGASGPYEGFTPFECDGSIPSGPTVRLDENGYWRVGPDDPGGSYCEGGDLVFYDYGRRAAPIARIDYVEDMDRVATAIETTGCDTIVGDLRVGAYQDDSQLRDLDALAGLHRIRYGILSLDGLTQVESIVGLGNIVLVDGFVVIPYEYSVSDAELVASRQLESVKELGTYPDPEFTCEIEPPPEEASLFDPDQVYILGSWDDWDFYTWEPGMPPFGHPYIAPMDDPMDLTASPPEEATEWIVRPSDGRLVYLADGGIRVFQADPWAVGAVQQYVWPDDSMGNDPEIETVCQARTLHVAPDDGTVVYGCADLTASSRCDLEDPVPCTYHTDAGADFDVAADYLLLHIGFDGHLLIQGDYSLAVQDASGAVTELSTAIPLLAVASVQATSDGFYVYTEVLLHIGHDGTVTQEGTFPPAPEEMRWGHRSASCKLDSTNTKYCVDSSFEAKSEDYEAVIVRYELGADSAEVVYEEYDWLLRSPVVVSGP